jgi:hypothetical protein
MSAAQKHRIRNTMPPGGWETKVRLLPIQCGVRLDYVKEESAPVDS